jgi:hypothetical protein
MTMPFESKGVRNSGTTPHNIDTTVAALADASDQDDQAAADTATHRQALAECDRKLAQ